MFKGDRDADYKVIREAILEVTKTRVMGVSLAASQLKDESDVKGGRSHVDGTGVEDPDDRHQRHAAGAGLEICDSRASSREMASFNWRATVGWPRGASLRGASLRGAGFEIWSIWRVIASSR